MNDKPYRDCMAEITGVDAGLGVNTDPIEAVDTSIGREFARAFVRSLFTALAWIGLGLFVVAGGFLAFEIGGGTW